MTRDEITALKAANTRTLRAFQRNAESNKRNSEFYRLKGNKEHRLGTLTALRNQYRAIRRLRAARVALDAMRAEGE